MTKPLRILIVEDDGLFQLTHKIRLRQVFGQEASIDVAGDAETAVDFLAREKRNRECYDAYIIDGNFPGGDGLEIAGRISEEDRRKVRIFSSDGAVLEEAKKRGFIAYDKDNAKGLYEDLRAFLIC